MKAKTPRKGVIKGSGGIIRADEGVIRADHDF